MRKWLEARRAGQVIMPDPDAKTSCLRPARSTTLREKLEKGMLPAGSQLWSSSAATPVQEKLLELKTSDAHPLLQGATPQGVLHGGAAKTGGAAQKRGRQGAAGGLSSEGARKKAALASPMPWVSPTGQAAVQILQNLQMLQGHVGVGAASVGSSPGVSPLAPGGPTLMMAPPSSAKRGSAGAGGGGGGGGGGGVPDLLSPGTANATELLRQLSKPVDTVSPPALPCNDDTSVSLANSGSDTKVAALPSAAAGPQPAATDQAGLSWQQGFL